MEKDNHDKQIYFVPIHSHHLWQSEIVPHLKRLSEGVQNANEVIETLMMFNQRYCWRRKVFPSYRNKKINEYQALKDLYQQKLPSICKMLAAFLLQFKPQQIPLVMGGKSVKLNYKTNEFFYLITLMFFSLVPKQYTDGKEYLQKKFNNSNNFLYLLSHNHFKTQCIVQFLRIGLNRIVEKKEQLLTIIRNVETQKRVDQLINAKKEVIMTKMKLESNDRSIEEFNGQIKTDFANRFIGGGCLTDGSVQQEIMFALHPQLNATTLLCQKMEDNEALAFIGFRRYFNNKGYGNTTSFDGFANVGYDMIGDYQVKQYITAIDAIKFKLGSKEQFQRHLIDRQIMKAYVGFSAIPLEGRIVTGGWGCGVYHGDIQAKMLIQWIAASLAEKQMIFCPFGKKNILEQENLLKNLKGKTIQQVYELLLSSCQSKLLSKGKKQSLYFFAANKVHSKM